MSLGSMRTVWQRISRHTLARIGKNALALLIVQAGAKVCQLVLTAQLARTLGVAALGRYLLALTVEAIALAIADLGLNVYSVREFARELARGLEPRANVFEPGQDTAQRLGETGQGPQALWGTVLALKLLFAFCALLVMNILVAPLFFPGERRVLIAIVSLALLPEALSGIATALIKARQRMEISSAINLAVRLAAAVSGVLLVRQGYQERAVLWAYVIASLLGSCAFVGVLWAWRVRANVGDLVRRGRTVLREAVPFAITGMVTILFSRIDLLVLAHWQGDLAAGLYGAAYRVWEALGMIPASALDALFPELSRVSANVQDRARLRVLYDRGRTFVWLLVALVALPCFVLAPYLMALFYGQSADTAISGTLFRVLLFAFPFTYLYLLNGHLLYALGEQLWVTRAMVAATAVNALLNVLVVPRWSYWGASGVTLLSQILLSALLRGIAGRTMLRAAAESRHGQKERIA